MSHLTWSRFWLTLLVIVRASHVIEDRLSPWHWLYLLGKHQALIEEPTWITVYSHQCRIVSDEWARISCETQIIGLKFSWKEIKQKTHRWSAEVCDTKHSNHRSCPKCPKTFCTYKKTPKYLEFSFGFSWSGTLIPVVTSNSPTHLLSLGTLYSK